MCPPSSDEGLGRPRRPDGPGPCRGRECRRRVERKARSCARVWPVTKGKCRVVRGLTLCWKGFCRVVRGWRRCRKGKCRVVIPPAGHNSGFSFPVWGAWGHNSGFPFPPPATLSHNSGFSFPTRSPTPHNSGISFPVWGAWGHNSGISFPGPEVASRKSASPLPACDPTAHGSHPPGFGATREGAERTRAPGTSTGTLVDSPVAPWDPPGPTGHPARHLSLQLEAARVLHLLEPALALVGDRAELGDGLLHLRQGALLVH